ncbi:MAG: toxin [Spirochaetes bacterium]|nr:toxin [Spirochaetota bacterium]MBN2772386.1 toxin [Spirochaetota bacterium]
MIKWNADKDKLLQSERGYSYKEIAVKLVNNDIIDIIENQNFPNQMIFVMEIGNYIYAVSFVMDWIDVFLNTIYPGRKLMKKYRG